MRRVITRVTGTRAVRYVSSVTLEHSVIEYYISHVRGSAPYSTPQWSQLRSITNDVAEPRRVTYGGRRGIVVLAYAFIKFPRRRHVTRTQNKHGNETAFERCYYFSRKVFSKNLSPHGGQLLSSFTAERCKACL